MVDSWNRGAAVRNAVGRSIDGFGGGDGGAVGCQNR